MTAHERQVGGGLHANGRHPNRTGGRRRIWRRSRRGSALLRMAGGVLGVALLAGSAAAAGQAAGDAATIAEAVLDTLSGEAGSASLYSAYVPGVTGDLADQAMTLSGHLPGRMAAAAIVITLLIGLGGITLALWRDLGERIRHSR